MTDELKKIYSNHSDMRMHYEAVELSHSTFATRYLIRANQNMTFDGVEYEAFPFSIIEPEKGDVQQDINIVFDNVSLELISTLELASTQHTPIRMVYKVFTDGEVGSQNTPITLSLTNVVVDAKTIQATATRPDLYARKFPYGNTTIYDKKFVGLYL